MLQVDASTPAAHVSWSFFALPSAEKRCGGCPEALEIEKSMEGNWESRWQQETGSHRAFFTCSYPLGQKLAGTLPLSSRILIFQVECAWKKRWKKVWEHATWKWLRSHRLEDWTAPESWTPWVSCHNMLQTSFVFHAQPPDLNFDSCRTTGDHADQTNEEGKPSGPSRGILELRPMRI